MTLPVSPNTITAADINVELGRAATDPFDINGAEERALAGIASGAISFSDFWGKSAGPVCTYSDITLDILDVQSDSFPGYPEAGFSYDFSANNRYFGTGTNTVIYTVDLFGILINDQSGGTFRFLLSHDATIGAIPQDFFDSLVVQGVGTLTSASATYTASLGTAIHDTTEWKWVTGVTIAAAGFTNGASRTVNLVNAVTNLSTCYPVPPPLFNDSNFIGYGGSWDSSTVYAFPAQQGTSMGGGTWVDPFVGVETVASSGIPGSSGNTVRVSGTYVPGGFEDLVIYVETHTGEFYDSVSVNYPNGTDWYIDVNLSGFTGNFKKFAYFSNGAYFPMKIDTIIIL